MAFLEKKIPDKVLTQSPLEQSLLYVLLQGVTWQNEKCFENIKVITKNEFVILP